MQVWPGFPWPGNCYSPLIRPFLLLEKRAEIPPKRQKVGEATSQVGGYYFSKVLDLEEHLLREHFMKYNLRFYWKRAARENRCSRTTARRTSARFLISPPTSSIVTRSKRNCCDATAFTPNFTLAAPVTDRDVALRQTVRTASPSPCMAKHEVHADWVVDTSGRSEFLARQLGLQQPSPIRHGTSFLWVKGW